MFRIAKKDQTYLHPVTVQVPVGNDSTQPMTFTDKFLYLPTSDFRAIFSTQNLTQKIDHAVIAEFLVGWENIENHDGTLLAFSGEALKQLCDIRYWAQAVVEAYIEFHSGLPAKNSPAPPATG